MKRRSIAELTQDAIEQSLPGDPHDIPVIGPDDRGRYFLNFVMPPERIGRAIINRAALEKININFWK